MSGRSAVSSCSSSWSGDGDVGGEGAISFEINSRQVKCCRLKWTTARYTVLLAMIVVEVRCLKK